MNLKQWRGFGKFLVRFWICVGLWNFENFVAKLWRSYCIFVFGWSCLWVFWCSCRGLWLAKIWVAVEEILRTFVFIYFFYEVTEFFFFWTLCEALGTMEPLVGLLWVSLGELCCEIEDASPLRKLLWSSWEVVLWSCCWSSWRASFCRRRYSTPQWSRQMLGVTFWRIMCQGSIGHLH